MGGVRDVPLHARVVLRTLVRRAACGLAARWTPLHEGRRVRGALVSTAADRRVARRLLSLPVAPSDGAERLDRPRRERRACGRRGIPPELRALVRARIALRPEVPPAVIARVATIDGVLEVDLETGEAELGAGTVEPEQVDTGLPRVVCAASAGSTVAVVVDSRPPLVVSHDAGQTWREAGRGLPPGFAIAIGEDDP